MRYQVNCPTCKECIWVHGVYEPDTNATVLDENDSEWDNACDHIKAGDYEILPDEQDEELPEDYTRDHGDSVWPR